MSADRPDFLELARKIVPCEEESIFCLCAAHAAIARLAQEMYETGEMFGREESLKELGETQNTFIERFERDEIGGLVPCRACLGEDAEHLHSWCLKSPAPTGEVTAPAAPALTRKLFEDFEREHQKSFYSADYRAVAAWVRAADEALVEIEARVADGYVSSSQEMGMLLSIARAARLATTPDKGGA